MKQTRFAQLQEQAVKWKTEPEHDLPDLEAGQYLVDAMFKLRPTRSSAAGMVPTDWPEIAAFAAVTQRIDEPWECEALFDMCQAYYEELHTGEKPLAIPPVERG
jgi:hypothetical protein